MAKIKLGAVKRLEPGETPIPGGSFEVPCVNRVPVLLPGHEDRELCVQGGEEFHYHVDWRWNFRANLGDEESGDYWLDWLTPDYNRAIRGDKVVWRQMVCGRSHVTQGAGLSFAMMQSIRSHWFVQHTACNGRRTVL